jgi:hypothetical protein
MGLIRIQIHLDHVDRFEWIQTPGTVSKPTRQWRRLPCLKSPTECRPTRRRHDRVLPSTGPPPPPCASLPDPLHLIHLPPHTRSPPHPAVIAAHSFPLPPLLPFPCREHLLAPLTFCPKLTVGATPVSP